VRFSRDQRLLTKADFKAVFDKAFKVNQRHLVALFKKNDLPYARLGLVISKRAVRKATARNRIKRIARNSFRLNQEKLVGFDIIILARQQCDTLDKTKLREGIDQLWEKLLKQSQVLSS
jgi:ribonuclease P protein component